MAAVRHFGFFLNWSFEHFLVFAGAHQHAKFRPNQSNRCKNIAIYPFLPCNAMLSTVYVRYMPSSCVCVCVFLSVTLRYCIKTAKRRITQITPHDSPLTLVFWHRNSRRNLNGITHCGHFRQEMRNNSKTVQDRRIVSIKVEQEVICALSNGDVSDDLGWRQTTPIFAFFVAFHLFVLGERRDFKIGTLVDRS